MPITLGDTSITSSTGNLGIGTTTANFPVSIGASSRGVDFSGGNRLSLKNANSSAHTVALDSFGPVELAADTNANTPSGALITFKVSDTERMRIAANGRVGIGTASPIGRVTVQNSISVIRNTSLAMYTTVIGQGGSTTQTIGTFSGNAGATAIVTLRGGHHYATASTPGPMQMYQKMAIIRVNGNGTLNADNNRTVFVSTTGSGATQPNLVWNTSTGVLTVATEANQGAYAIIEVVWGAGGALFTPSGSLT